MARLKCHGRELLRIEKEVNETNPESTTWNRRTRVYMSDGKIMEKFDVRFKPDTFRPTGEFYSYGWKITATKKKEVSQADYEAMITRVAESTGKPGTKYEKWVKLSGGPKPVIISASKIMRAIESGDNLGFCKACGSEAYGVEPDARNYTCESCGAREVYGA